MKVASLGAERRGAVPASTWVVRAPHDRRLRDRDGGRKHRIRVSETPDTYQLHAIVARAAAIGEQRDRPLPVRVWDNRAAQLVSFRVDTHGRVCAGKRGPRSVHHGASVRLPQGAGPLDAVIRCSSHAVAGDRMATGRTPSKVPARGRAIAGRSLLGAVGVSRGRPRWRREGTSRQARRYRRLAQASSRR